MRKTPNSILKQERKLRWNWPGLLDTTPFIGGELLTFALMIDDPLTTATDAVSLYWIVLQNLTMPSEACPTSLRPTNGQGEDLPSNDDPMCSRPISRLLEELVRQDTIPLHHVMIQPSSLYTPTMPCRFPHQRVMTASMAGLPTAIFQVPDTSE